MFYLELRHFGDEGEVPSLWAPCLIMCWATCYVDLVTLAADLDKLEDFDM